ncbi:hypothetical protein BW733_14580 [Tessaracoccus flavescens]|uniref:Uncharacterized protein n=1 Tax=Tessaracoccus flavescens TaxID=399497 RepID=A0A1Q2D0C5_9ACTN|nr:hypothetical protein BW733_14580 [Tessaracoccus flavescens]
MVFEELNGGLFKVLRGVVDCVQFDFNRALVQLRDRLHERCSLWLFRVVPLQGDNEARLDVAGT